MVDILPSGNILKVSENNILTMYYKHTYVELWSMTMRLGADGSHICDAALIDANNILIVTYNRMWHVNMSTEVETDAGEGLRSDKQTDPVKYFFFLRNKIL